MVFRDIDKQAIIENKARFLTKIQIVGTDTIFTEDDYVVEWAYEDFRYVPENGFIGQFVEKIFDGKLSNIPEDAVLVDQDINLQLGVINDIDNETTWYDYGNFMITKVSEKDTNGVLSFESADYTKRFNQVYIDNIQYPCTALELAENVCNQVHVELATKDFTNKDFVIQNNQFIETSTCRDVMKAIAQLAYSWVRVGNDNRVYIDFTVKEDIDTYNNITPNEYYELKKEQYTFGPVNRVLIGMSQVTGENIYIDNGEVSVDDVCQIAIYDNPLTYTEDLRRIAIEGASRLFGLTYSPLTINTIGHPWLEGDDLIKVTTLDGEELITYPFDRKLSYKGYIKSEMSSQAKTSVSSKYDYDGRVEKALSNAEIVVDKANRTINSYVTDVTDLKETLVLSNSASGYPIEITDAGEYNLESIGIDGKSEQDGTPTPDNPIEIKTVKGIRNLFDKSTNIIANKDLNTNGTTFDSTVSSIKQFFEIKPNTTYTYSGFSDSSYTKRVCVYSSNNESTFLSVFATTGDKLRFTTPSNAKYLRIQFKTTELNNIMLEEGTIAHNYFPYGSWLEQKTIGINHFDGLIESGSYNNSTGVKLADNTTTRNINPVAVLPKYNYIFSNNGIGVGMNVFEYDEKMNFLKYTGAIFANNYFQVSEKTHYINFYRANTNVDKIQLNIGDKVLPYEPYKESNALIDMNKSNLFDNVAFVEGSSKYYSYDETTGITINELDRYVWSSIGYKIKIGNNKQYKISVTNIDDYSTLKFWQFKSDGTWMTSIFPSSDGLVTFNSDCSYVTLKIIPSEYPKTIGFITLISGCDDYYEFCSNGDIRDTFKDGLLTKKILKVVLDGSENITTNPNGTNSYNVDIGKLYKRNPNLVTLMCSHFKAISYNNRTLNENNICYLDNNGTTYQLTFRNTTFTTVETFKNWLATNKPIVYYELAEPQTYKLNYESLKLFKGYNYINDNDELEANIDIKYLTDSEVNAVYMSQIEQSSKNVKINITNVRTTTGFTFDENGLKIEKSNAPTSTTVDEKGLTVSDKSGGSSLYAGFDDESAETIVNTNRLILNDITRFETFTDPLGNKAIGPFWLS